MARAVLAVERRTGLCCRLTRDEKTGWRDRPWHHRFFDRHPVVTGLVWLAIMVPKGIVDLVRRRRQRR